MKPIKEEIMSFVVSRVASVVLFVLEAVLWVFVLKTFEKGFKSTEELEHLPAPRQRRKPPVRQKGVPIR
jgi:hypothetical protein